MKFSFETEMGKLPLAATEKWKEGVWDVEVYKHGTMLLEVFAPRNKDYQTPHDQDELYFVMRGQGEFVLGDGTGRNAVRLNFKTGDALFVPAGVVHRFENFSDDLATWVVFWGKQGGEGEREG